MGFREDATTVELQTWYVFSLVKAEFPAHLTSNKNEAYISIQEYQFANSLRRAGQKSHLLKHNTSKVTFFSKKFIVWKYFHMPLEDKKHLAIYFQICIYVNPFHRTEIWN